MICGGTFFFVSNDNMHMVCLFGREDMALGVEYLQNLTKIPRFDMIIMCLSSADKAGMSTHTSVNCNGVTS